MIVRILALFSLLYLLGYVMFAGMLPRPADDRETDAIVVLTGAAKRIERGLDLLERKRAKRMLVSGVARSVRQAELAHEYPGYERLFECCIDLGRQSVDTRSNGEEVARWVERRKFSSVRLVSTDWHMPRAQFEIARRMHGNVEVVGDAVESNPSFTQLFTEYNKYLLRRAAVFVGL